MTVTIHRVPLLFEPVIDEMLSLYGIMLSKKPITVACQSQEKFICLQERLKEARLSYTVVDEETITFGAEQYSEAVRLLLHNLPAEEAQDGDKIKVKISDRQHQKEFTYLLHYVLANYAANAFIIMSAEQSVKRYIVEVARPLDYHYCEPLRLLLLQVPHGRKQRSETIIRRLLGPSASVEQAQTAWQQKGPQQAQPQPHPKDASGAPEHIIEISAEHSLMVSLTDFYLLRSQFVFSRAEIIDENQIELFFTDFSNKQAAARYLEACRRERDSAMRRATQLEDVCFVVGDGRRDIQRIQQLRPLRVALSSSVARCAFRNCQEKDSAVRAWLYFGGKVIDIDKE